MSFLIGSTIIFSHMTMNFFCIGAQHIVPECIEVFAQAGEALVSDAIISRCAARSREDKTCLLQNLQVLRDGKGG